MWAPKPVGGLVHLSRMAALEVLGAQPHQCACLLRGCGKCAPALPPLVALRELRLTRKRMKRRKNWSPRHTAQLQRDKPQWERREVFGAPSTRRCLAEESIRGAVAAGSAMRRGRGSPCPRGRASSRVHALLETLLRRSTPPAKLRPRWLGSSYREVACSGDCTIWRRRHASSRATENSGSRTRGRRPRCRPLHAR